MTVALVATGCGSVALIDPDQPTRDALVLTTARRIAVSGDDALYVLAETRVPAIAADYHFELDGPEGRVVVPDDAVEALTCPDDRLCWAIALGPLPRVPDQLVLVVPSLEHESRAALAVVDTGPLAVSALVTPSGRGLEVGVADPVASAARDQLIPWMRTFDMIATPGACADPVAEDDARWARRVPARHLLAAELPSAEDPALCLEVRPNRPRGAPAASRRSVWAPAQIESFDHVYAPPVEVAPLVWMVVSDLHLPSETACARNESRLERAVADAAQAIAAEAEAPITARPLAPLRLAVAGGRPCQQDPDRRLDVLALLGQIDAEVDEAFGDDARVRTLVVYANNLDTEPSQGLLEDFDALVRVASLDPRRPIALLSVSPPRGVVGPAVGTVEFAAANEPAFGEALLSTLRTVWPFRTVVHRGDTRVPLVSAAQRSRFLLYRVVSATTEVAAIGAPVADVLAPDADGPAYRVALPIDELAPAAQFLRPAVRVTWEGCLGACTQPPAGRAPPAAWTLDP